MPQVRKLHKKLLMEKNSYYRQLINRFVKNDKINDTIQKFKKHIYNKIPYCMNDIIIYDKLRYTNSDGRQQFIGVCIFSDGKKLCARSEEYINDKYSSPTCINCIYVYCINCSEVFLESTNLMIYTGKNNFKKYSHCCVCACNHVLIEHEYSDNFDENNYSNNDCCINCIKCRSNNRIILCLAREQSKNRFHDAFGIWNVMINTGLFL